MMDIYNNEEELEFERDQMFYEAGTYEPFVYIVRVIDQDKFYIGMKVARGCLRTDLGSKYFTSSNIVKELWAEDVGNVEVLETLPCNSNWDTMYLEGKMIVDHDAVEDERYLNRGYGGVLFNRSGVAHSEDHRARISEANKGEKSHMWGKSLSDETRAKLSEAQKGEKSHMWGKSLSDETRAKISEAHNGKTLSDETRAKLSESKKGKFPSDESRAKMSEPQKGRTHSDETKAKMSEARKGEKCYMWGRPSADNPRARAVNQLDKLTGAIIATFSTAKEAAESVKGHGSGITNACRGKRKSACGYRWEYAQHIHKSKYL
jgi:hypothetical protein